MEPTLDSLLAARFGATAAPRGIPEALARETHRVQLAHRSVRDFRPDPLPEGALELILACAQSAPTSSNLNAYSVVVIESAEARARAAALAGDQPWIARCPVFLLFCADARRLAILCAEAGAPAPAGNAELLLLAAVDAALAGMSAMTAAEAAGLGAVMIGGVRERPEEIAALAGLPGGVFALFGMCVGRAAEPGSVRPRPAPAMTVHRERYDESVVAPGLRDYAALTAPQFAARGADGYLARTARRLRPEAMRGHMGRFLDSRGFALP